SNRLFVAQGALRFHIDPATKRFEEGGVVIGGVVLDRGYAQQLPSTAIAGLRQGETPATAGWWQSPGEVAHDRVLMAVAPEEYVVGAEDLCRQAPGPALFQVGTAQL